MATASMGGIQRVRRALIVHRHLLFADALTRTLERMGLVTTTVTDPEVAVDAVLACSPHVALIEVGRRGRTGLSLASRIRAIDPDTPLIAVAPSAEPDVIVASRMAGFRSVVSNDMPLPRLLRVVEGALEDADRAGRHRGLRKRRDDRDPRDHEVAFRARQLTAREWDVLGLLVEGASGDDICERLGLRANTVRSHVQSILTKLQVHSRLEAAGLAVRCGLVPSRTADASR